MTNITLDDVKIFLSRLNRFLDELKVRDNVSLFIDIRSNLIHQYSNMDKLLTDEGLLSAKQKLDMYEKLLSYSNQSEYMIGFVLEDLKSFDLFTNTETSFNRYTQRYYEQDRTIEKIVDLNSKYKLYTNTELNVLKLVLTEYIEMKSVDEDFFVKIKEVTDLFNRKDASNELAKINKHLSEIGFFSDFHNIELFYDFKKELSYLGEKSDGKLDYTFETLLTSKKPNEVKMILNNQKDF